MTVLEGQRHWWEVEWWLGTLRDRNNQKMAKRVRDTGTKAAKMLTRERHGQRRGERYGRRRDKTKIRDGKSEGPREAQRAVGRRKSSRK